MAKANVQAKANEPTGLPVVEDCARKVKKKGKDKSQAIAICVRSLKKAGRIKKQNGQWVQLSGSKQTRSRE